jgi:hypothetical protein
MLTSEQASAMFRVSAMKRNRWGSKMSRDQNHQKIVSWQKATAVSYQRSAAECAQLARDGLFRLLDGKTHREQDEGLNAALWYQGEAEAASRGARGLLLIVVG